MISNVLASFICASTVNNYNPACNHAVNAFVKQSNTEYIINSAIKKVDYFLIENKLKDTAVFGALAVRSYFKKEVQYKFKNLNFCDFLQVRGGLLNNNIEFGWKF